MRRLLAIWGRNSKCDLLYKKVQLLVNFYQSQPSIYDIDIGWGSDRLSLICPPKGFWIQLLFNERSIPLSWLV